MLRHLSKYLLLRVHQCELLRLQFCYSIQKTLLDPHLT
jgi:hypothetical protein